MGDNYNNMFVWKSYKGFTKEEHKNKEVDDLKYWKTRTTDATNSAIKKVIIKNNSEMLNDSDADNVYSEAKNLVKSWLTNKKVYGNYYDKQSFLNLSDDELEFNVPTRIEIHKEWEHLVQRIETKEEYKAEMSEYLSKDNDNLKEDKKLKSVLANLHKKTFVDSSKLRNVDSPKPLDMKKRIENRQEEVKKKREEKQKKEEIKRLEILAGKEARVEAMKMLKEEKKQKELSFKKEEELLQIEMNKIRCELQRKREQEMLESKRLKETQELIKLQEKHKVSTQKLEETTKALDSNIKKNSNERFKIIAEIVEKKVFNKNLQLIGKYFRAWKNEIESAKLKMERAKVWFAWKNSRKIFRAWYSYSRSARLYFQINVEQERIKLIQMKENMAVNFWKNNLLKKCILNWSLFVIDEKESRWCEKLEEMRKKKMISYIEAIQEKAMENQAKLDKLSLETFEKNKLKDESISNRTTQSHLTNETARSSHRSNKSLQSQIQCTSARPAIQNKKPKEAWQITKKDVYLPLDQLIDNVNQDEKYSETPHNRKSLKPPKIINSFAHRDAAQKELIRQQKSKIKEQQKLIEFIKADSLLKQIKENRNLISNSSESDNRIHIINSPTELHEDDENLEKNYLPNTKLQNQFVLKMEARAKERERIRVERLEKQKKQDEEKKKQLEEKLLEQTKLEFEEKIKREKLLKEKREKERLKEESKQKRVKREQECNQIADNFYKHLLLKHYGIERFKKLVTAKLQNHEKAQHHYELTILKKSLDCWKRDVETVKEYQDKIVKSFYYRILMRRCIYHMKLFKHRYELMEESADSHYLKTLMKISFNHWRTTNHRQQIRLDKLGIQCDNLYERSLKMQMFTTWRQLPMAKRKERERERRIDILRQKVTSIIPDFKPVYDNKS